MAAKKKTRCIAFHSYKGGTGKTTLACNVAALLVKKGFNVCLLDLDVYAPSMQTYFGVSPKYWINDYLNSDVSIKDVMINLTDTIHSIISKNQTNNTNEDYLKGNLWVAFSSPDKEDVLKLDSGGSEGGNLRKQRFRKFILLREKIISENNADYVIIDTSPGIRYWSINALALSETILLTLKMGDLDIDGTKKIASNLYESFTHYGTKSFLLCNRVAGYCIPHTFTVFKDDEGKIKIKKEHNDDFDVTHTLSKDIHMEIISSIPCYCDIQFSKKEFLSVLELPNHPFTNKINELTEAL
jgi:MinD-like ATPase involved in chromosome partitioning or flagellar assembly